MSLMFLLKKENKVNTTEISLMLGVVCNSKTPTIFLFSTKILISV